MTMAMRDEAWLYASPYRCRACDGRAEVHGQRVRVRHSSGCSLGERLRRDYPLLYISAPSERKRFSQRQHQEAA